MHVDRNTGSIARATVASSDEPEPNARFIIWPRPDGPALIVNYLDWLGRCGSTRVDARSADGADAAVAVTRSSASAGTYHVMYYAVRGVLLECATNLEGADVDLVKRLGAQTLQRLRAL